MTAAKGSKTKITPFDPAEFLDNDETIATYLNEARAAGDAAHCQDALNAVARARGMTSTDKKAR